MARRGWLGIAGAAMLSGLVPPDHALAQASDHASDQTKLPEVQVIATTPVSAPRRRAPRPAGRAPAAAPATTSQPVTETATGIPDPSVIDRDKVPASVETLAAPAFDHALAPSLLDAFSRGLPGVSLGDQTGNPFQRDLDYRGFTASPVIGKPQGLAVYQNGVRINEVFGDIVNWDFIPESAISQMALVPNNPAYGLNALGGALSLEMKNGFGFQGVNGELRGGSFGRRAALVEAGGQNGNLSGYVAADAINDDGWRNYSPSQLRRIYADVGARGEDTEFHVNFTGASNSFGAAATTPVELLNQNWASTYTVPQTTANKLAFLIASGNWRPSDTLSVDGNVYYRGFWQSHVDGNATSAQNTGCPDPTLLCFPDLTGNLSNLTTIGGQTVPATGTLGSSVLGEIDRTWTSSNSFGGTLQAASSEKLLARDNHFVVGMSIDRGLVQFTSNSELGIVNADQFPVVQGTGLFIDQPSGDVAPVGLGARTLYTGIYATDTLDVTPRLSLSAGGRFNVAWISLMDEFGNNIGLNGNHEYDRFNPMIGATYKITPNVTAYAGYSEANRAPTPLELGCSDPLRPCLIDNSLVADPELKQVVAHTVEAGLRGRLPIGRNGLLNWSLGLFRTENTDDIIAAASPLPGHEYFLNGGNTLRHGIEAKATYTQDRWSLYANATWIDAVFLDALTLSSPNNPFADANGNIFVAPGDHLPAVPNIRVKAGAEYQATEAWKVGADLNVIGSQYLVGDEANQNPKIPAYWTINLHTSYKVSKNVELFGLVQNLFNQRFYTYGTFFDVNSFPYLNLTDPRTFMPGAPLAAYAGVRASF